MNYLQTVAAVGSLAVSWIRPVPLFFKIWGISLTFDARSDACALTDVMGSSVILASTFALDCLLPVDLMIPRTILRQILVALQPVVIILLIAFPSVFNCLVKRRKALDLLKRFILISVVVLYNAYLSLAMTAVDTFTCVPVHDGTSLEEDDSLQLYWTLDTSIKCYEREHLLLVVCLSLPLILFAVIFPMVFAVALINSYRKGTLSSDWTKETMGFLFSGFEERFVFWDATILVRKAILSAIVVFAYELGEDLQGLLAVVLLVLSLFFQTTFNPYRNELELNKIESMSLTISVLTFLAAMILNSSTISSAPAEYTSAAVLLTSNVVFFASLVCFMGKVKLDQLKMELQIEGVDCGCGRFWDVIIAGTRHKVVEVFQRAFGRFFQGKNGRFDNAEDKAPSHRLIEMPENSAK